MVSLPEMVKSPEIDVHEESLGNYCYSWPIVISTSKPAERFLIYVCAICQVLHSKSWSSKTWDDVIHDDLKSWNLVKDNEGVGSSGEVRWKVASKGSDHCFKEKRC